MWGSEDGAWTAALGEMGERGRSVDGKVKRSGSKVCRTVCGRLVG